MNKLRRLLQKVAMAWDQFSCFHEDTHLVRWHWTHYPNGCEPRSVEAEYQCEACGKLLYMHLFGRAAHEWADAMGDYKKA